MKNKNVFPPFEEWGIFGPFKDVEQIAELWYQAEIFQHTDFLENYKKERKELDELKKAENNRFIHTNFLVQFSKHHYGKLLATPHSFR